MPLDIDDPTGKNLYVVDDTAEAVSGRIKFTGKASSVFISRGCVSSSIYFEIGSNVVVRIGSNCRLGNLMIHASGENSISIGTASAFNGNARLLLHEAGSIEIGADCLIAAHTDFLISDMHSILDAVSGKRLNPAANIKLANHVWVGEGAVVLKGVHIDSDSVVGARAVVTRSVARNTVVAGNPARVVKSGVTWDFKLGRV